MELLEKLEQVAATLLERGSSEVSNNPCMGCGNDSKYWEFCPKCYIETLLENEEESGHTSEMINEVVIMGMFYSATEEQKKEMVKKFLEIQLEMIQERDK